MVSLYNQYMVRDFIPAGGTPDPAPVNNTRDFIGSSAAFIAAQAAATTVYGPYTPTYTNQAVMVDASSAPVTVTLPTAVGNLGFRTSIKKTDSTANAVTVATTGSQLIEGASTRVISVQYQSLDFISDGSNWVVNSSFKGVN